MDHEYDMDLLTYGFTPSDDAVWYRSAHGVRTFMGSIHKSRFATQTRFRHQLHLGGRHTVLLDAMQQEDLAAQRFFIEIGYMYRLDERSQIGFSQTVAAYKPDLDFTLLYALDSPRLGLIQAELGLLDAANNLIFDRLGVDPVLEDTVRSFIRKPRIFEMSWRSREWAGFRREVMVGIQPRSKAVVQSQQTSDLRFRWNEQVHYVASLLEYDYTLLTTGIMYRHTFGKVGRHSASDARHETAYSAAQSSHSATLYVLAPVWRLRTGLWLTAEGYVDDQSGTAFDQASIEGEMNYRERRLTLHARVEYVPQRGIRAGLNYFVDHRAFMQGADMMNAYLRFLPWSPNGRLAMNVGYHFSENAHVVIGGAYDVGGDPFYNDDRGAVRYDGGFGRVVVTW